MKRFLLIVLLTALVVPCMVAQFTAGNLVVVRIGDGSATLTSAATAVFLDEYTPAGARVRSVALPTTVAGSNGRFTNSGSASSEGSLTRSADSRYLVLGGYDADLGTASIASTTTVNRVVARVDAQAKVDVTTKLSDAYAGNNIRGACSVDGTGFWTSGTSSTAGSVRYAALGATTSTQLSTTITNIRVVNVFRGQLYCSSSSGVFLGVSQVGTGTPTATGQTITLLQGFPTSGTHSTYGFSMSPDGNTMYVADDGTTPNGGGIEKWTLSGGTWSMAYTLGRGVRGLTVNWSGSNPIIYATDTASVTNNLWVVTDAGASSVPTILATAATNTIFRGVAFAPLANATAVHEVAVPTAFSLSQNYPNPFNPSTTLRYSIVEPGTTTLKIFNMLGEAVATIVNEHKSVGTFNAVWDASHQPSGVYIARLVSVSDSKQMSTQSRRLMLVK